MSDYSDLQREIKNHEGYSLNPYQLEYKNADGEYIKENVFTGGYGHVLKKDEVAPTTEEGWEAIFQKDFNIALEGAEALLQDCKNIHPIAKEVIIEMCYQIGTFGVSKFKKMFQALAIPDYVLAAQEMTDSKWFVQTPSRANRMAIKMRNCTI